MTKFRVAVIFLLLAGFALIGARGADIRGVVPLELTLADAGVWLRTHVAPATRIALLTLSSPTRELSDYCSNNLIASLGSLGIDSIKWTNGDMNAALSAGRTGRAGTIVIGSIVNTERGCQLYLQTIAGADSADLGQFTAIIRTDETLKSLLKFSPTTRRRMTVMAPSEGQ
ncbi:hypothetical protein AGMMS49587_20040 [Spirochaetia bacterium]|nr:hypothetical protein AGMMS49587_20040 [Spirochaetia bacterium]